MGKKKQPEVPPARAESSDGHVSTAASPASSAETTEKLGELAQEVQAFVVQRDQLAQRLADEIAATELRLAELKRTAASLFPTEQVPRAVPKDRRPKTTSTGRPAKQKAELAEASEPAANASPQSSAEEPGSGTAAPHEPHLD